MGDIFYTSAILRERADLRGRRPTLVQLERLAATYHGRPVRSIGIVREVESARDAIGRSGIRVTAYDEEGGDTVYYDVTGEYLATASTGADRQQFERWTKGQKVVVEGRLEWPRAEAVPIVVVAAVRHT